MNIVTFETQDLRVRIEDKIARVDQRKLEGEPWQEIDKDELPVTEHWRTSAVRASPSALKIALLAFERENPGDMSMRTALGA